VPTVLITGAGRGIGRATAAALAERGWTVYAGVRSDADAAALQSAGLQAVRLDITDQASLQALPTTLPDRLDALVNNAGIVESGPLEGITLERLRHQLEVNVVGQVAVTQQVLPLLRAAAGRIVFISSVSGRITTPLLGAYAASKFAVEALGDALRVELRPWGIDVSLVEPGSIDTDIWRRAEETANETERALSPDHRELYAKQIDRLRKLARTIQGRTTAPEKVADAVVHALTADRPRARYVVGADAKAQLAGRALLPTRAWDALLARVTASTP
jgi:NAD(P)-dependent dehydrogenase (short-subunit alcohol dehydrogenase family)